MLGQFTKKIENFCCQFPVAAYLCRKYYANVVQNEVKLGRIDARDRVLCIGGGPVPCTAIEIAMRTGAKVDVVDSDLEAVIHARSLIEKLHLTECMSVYHVRGECFDVKSYTVIHIAKQVFPRQEVLDWTLSEADIGTRVLIRHAKSRMKGLYTAPEMQICIKDIIEYNPSSDWLSETYLVIKSEGGEGYEKAHPFYNRTLSSSGANMAS